ncbi:MAG: cyclic nucleotide-binding domain-containing protein [Candidatus Scalindua rubra]|uniref:Two-component sensor kinase n=1 Tax=Candidatus Scalindua brodae TaxID=237368 RepID=A0A0B0EMF1_9BACT|nr:MAG: two-component sensor kinase [Candidatus Scalindua brodae]MBZ0109294.1 cyclic nucleotide-binding domain-containing protein [Candidatus Scalindua rubra]TWU36789.1 sensory histidine kinase AtoS [Candidatus Brocadiaceae bacterium S225]
MRDIIDIPEMQKYTVSFTAGKVIFLQGDKSQDMYFLVNGRIEVSKDNKKIADISEPGTTVGEMSYLLNARRTATVKALTDVTVIMVPTDQIEEMMHKYPSIAYHMSLKLAARLEETTRIMHGLKEFNDQLPDAIVMADKYKNILSWNQAAEKLHGRAWEQMKGYPLADLYHNQQDYEQFMADIQSGNSLREKELVVKHPDKNERYVSTSTTVLYDGHHNVEGYIFFSRDVTESKNLEKKYKRIKKWSVSAIVFSCLLIIAIFFTIPYFSRGSKILDYKKGVFKNRIIEDSQNITKTITGPLATGDLKAITDIMRIFFKDKSHAHFGIKGLLLLDRNKKVISAHSPEMSNAKEAMIGYSYTGIKFKGEETSSHKILDLFRADKENPMGAKGVEIAYEICNENGETTNWLIFQLEMEHLDREYGINTKILSKIDFRKD